jgi:hypothetical protein
MVNPHHPVLPVSTLDSGPAPHAAPTQLAVLLEPSQPTLERPDPGADARRVVVDLVCPTCGRADQLTYQERVWITRTVGAALPALDGAPGGTLVISGTDELLPDSGDDTPGIVCQRCNIDRTLYLPPGWEISWT